MEDRDIDRSGVSISNPSVLPKYVKIDNASISLLYNQFDVTETLDMYRSAEDEDTVLHDIPTTAKEVIELYEENEENWRNNKSALYIIEGRKRGFNGELYIHTIDWKHGMATADIHIRGGNVDVESVVEAFLHTLFSDLGLRLVQVRSKRNQFVGSVHNAVVSSNGQYEGVSRNMSSNQSVVVYDTWSITESEYLNDSTQYEVDISYPS